MSKSRRKQDNTMLWILLGILLVCFLLIGYLFWRYFYAGSSTSKYGDTRLQGIENYPLSENLESDIAAIYKDEKSFDKVTVHVEGKIIYINLVFKTSLKADAAESLAAKALGPIGTENLTFYEVQYLLTYSGEGDNVFPILGSKSNTSTKVTWTVPKQG